MIRRGELRWADLGPPRGSAPALRRPVLVVSADSFNQSGIDTVICLALTTNLRVADAPGNVLVDESRAGLSEASVVNVSQVITLDKQELGELLGDLPASHMDRVEAGMQLALGLSPVGG